MPKCNWKFDAFYGMQKGCKVPFSSSIELNQMEFAVELIKLSSRSSSSAEVVSDATFCWFMKE